MEFHETVLLFYLISSVPGTFSDWITLRQGILEGTNKQSANGTTFRAYYGVPYAKPPLGRLRFQPPEGAEPWEGVFNATVVIDAMCTQVPKFAQTEQGTEDCLHLNVFAPAHSKPGDDIPVIVYFFGGMLMFSSNFKDGPEYFMDNKIVFVQPNFRLGLLGYLSTGDEVISGNMGFKDQVMAMKWTKENIRAFGGDPNRITLYGYSSGSASCMYHTYSPLSRGLFERVIMQSGSAFHPNFLNTPEKARGTAQQLSRMLNCQPGNTSREILNCLQQKNASEIEGSVLSMALWKDPTAGPFGVVAEDPKAKDVFMTDSPIRSSFQSTQPEWLIGMTTAEAAQFVPVYFQNNNVQGDEINQHFSLLLPIINGFYQTAKPTSLNFMTRLMRTRYLQDQGISPDTDVQTVALVSDALFTFSITEAIKRYTGQRYVYKYDYRSNYSTQFAETNYTKYLGVAHADDLHLMFLYTDVSPQVFTRQDDAMRNELITRYINFAYSGNPNTPFPVDTISFEHWSPVSSDRIEYLYMSQTESVMKTDYNRDIHRFWKSTPAYSGFF